MSVHDALQAWQNGEIDEARALKLSGCDSVSGMLRLCVACDVEIVTVYDTLQAWQSGEITEDEAIRIVEAESVIELYKAAIASGVDLKIPMTAEQAAAVESLDW